MEHLESIICLFFYGVDVKHILCDKSFHYVASINYKFSFADLQKKKEIQVKERLLPVKMFDTRKVLNIESWMCCRPLCLD